MRMKIKSITLLVMVLSLAACTGREVRETLGVNKSAPDEFRVVSRPPLSVPPEFTLRPPAPGQEPLLEGDREREAQSLILGDDYSDVGEKRFLTLGDVAPAKRVETALDPVFSSSLESAAEATFLSNIGASGADPEIRTKLYEERSAKPVDDDASPLERWLGLSESSSVVDPEAESARIKENIEKEKPINEGEVKTLDSKEKSVLDKLFD